MVQKGGKFCIIEAGGWYYFDMTAGPITVIVTLSFMEC
jgi:hypothetical protein